LSSAGGRAAGESRVRHSATPDAARWGAELARRLCDDAFAPIRVIREAAIELARSTRSRHSVQPTRRRVMPHFGHRPTRSRGAWSGRYANHAPLYQPKGVLHPRERDFWLSMRAETGERRGRVPASRSARHILIRRDLRTD
jgi:hypothetical protein